jgi:hypothetical protein
VNLANKPESLSSNGGLLSPYLKIQVIGDNQRCFHLIGGVLFGRNPLNDNKQDDDKRDDQEVHENPHDFLDANFLFMTGHNLAIVPVLGYSAGTHGLSSKSYFIPSHRT